MTNLYSPALFIYLYEKVEKLKDVYEMITSMKKYFYRGIFKKNLHILFVNITVYVLYTTVIYTTGR